MTKIKICGLTCPRDVEAVNRARPDFAGFVVEVPSSKRSVSAHQARHLAALLDEGIEAVGVFVDAPLDLVAGLVEDGTLSAVQLHGNEDDAYIAALRERLGISADPSGDAIEGAFGIGRESRGAAVGERVDAKRASAERPCTIIQAFKITGPEDVERARRSTADIVLLDAGAGCGQTFDWSLVKSAGRPFILAGGLGPGLISEAVKKTSPFAVDMSSGVETDGRKDPIKIMEATMEAHGSVEAGMPDVAQKDPGRFGIHGGQYIPETLMNAVIELEQAYNRYRDDPDFNSELDALLRDYAGRPSRLYFAKRMTEDLGGARIYLKREDLNHTGAHKINNVLGQALLAKRMGKTRLIAETGAGQHGVATATAAALLGMECEVFMGTEDIERQALNVYKMRLLGSQVHPVDSGTGTLKDAVSETFREWTSRIDDTHYVLGSVMGPHPFPTIVRDFQAVISKEIKEQLVELEGRLPDAVIACVGGGSNAIGAFYHFIDDPEVRLIGCEAAGRGVDTFETAATIATGRLGIFHGMKSYFCQDESGQIAPVYSISAGLDYPGIGPEHAALHDSGRAEYVPVTDDEAVDAFEYLSRMEGIIPAIESAHAVAYARELAPKMGRDQIIVINISGRGDKDCAAIARYRGEDIHE